ncbi:unnamed protein product, partial [Sphacelaria rigidula]
LLPPKRQQVGAASLLKTLHLRSCALVVLSRGGVIDHMSSVEDAESRTAIGEEDREKGRGGNGVGEEPPKTPPLALAEAFIAAGARTVMQKMWYDEESALVDTILILCFYEELREATLAGEKRPVAIALREAQLWLRNATLVDILGRVQVSM